MNRSPGRIFRHLPLLVCLGVAAGLPGCRSTRSPDAGSDPPSGPVRIQEAGRWHPLAATSQEWSPEQRQALERLEALPYLAGSSPAPARSGVLNRKPQQVQAGINLYNSGHAPEALAIDLEGRVLHRWTFSIDRMWPDAGGHQSTFWRRVTWLPGGGLLAVFEGIGLIRLDRDSRLEWAYRGPIHHQAVVDRDGTILTLTRYPRVAARINPDSPVQEDFLLRLSAEGKRLDEISLLEAFETSPFRELLDNAPQKGDIFHTNSIEILDGSATGRLPAWQQGNVLLSMYFLDTICVLDPAKKTIVWALRGDRAPFFRSQHDPRWLPTGRLLLFDNRGRSGKSRALEFDPLTLEVTWQYPADPEADFFTPTCGTSQRLPNGNTLLTESDKGRALEVTPGGDVVWEFLNPHRAGSKGEWIATLFEVRRVAADYLQSETSPASSSQKLRNE